MIRLDRRSLGDVAAGALVDALQAAFLVREWLRRRVRRLTRTDTLEP